MIIGRRGILSIGYGSAHGTYIVSMTSGMASRRYRCDPLTSMCLLRRGFRNGRRTSGRSTLIYVRAGLRTCHRLFSSHIFLVCMIIRRRGILSVCYGTTYGTLIIPMAAGIASRCYRNFPLTSMSLLAFFNIAALCTFFGSTTSCRRLIPYVVVLIIPDLARRRPTTWFVSPLIHMTDISKSE